jgi:hypothetical protein
MTTTIRRYQCEPSTPSGALPNVAEAISDKAMIVPICESNVRMRVVFLIINIFTFNIIQLLFNNIDLYLDNAKESAIII